jgi:hypothetical protein
MNDMYAYFVNASIIYQCPHTKTHCHLLGQNSSAKRYDLNFKIPERDPDLANDPPFPESALPQDADQ